jgi:hypothetical protein
MDPLASFTAGTFRDRVGETFTVPAAEGAGLVLAAVDDKGSGAGARPGGAFSLVFQGPADLLLHQGIHEVTHAELGAFGLFLVPIAQTADGFRYEAAFN